MSIRVGARDKGQQLSSFKWSLPLSGGAWLYFGAPAAVISEDAGRAELLRDIGGSSAVGAVAAAAEALYPSPARLKIYYKAFSTGDAHPAPEMPAAKDASGRTRDPTDPEKAFALTCARHLASYDVTLRASRRIPDSAARILPARPFARPLVASFAEEPFNMSSVGVSRRDAEAHRMGITSELEQK